MNSYNQRFNINKHIKTCTKPLQKYFKYKIMKNLARTLSLFLIFSEKYYKSKMRNIVTELCYERCFTMQTNDKVLIKQTKNQSTYSFAGQKLTTLFSIHFWLKLLFNFFTLQDPLRLLYVHCKSSSSNCWIIPTKIQGIYTKLLWFISLPGQCPILWAMPCFVGNALFCGQCPVLWAMPCFLGNALSGLFLGL